MKAKLTKAAKAEFAKRKRFIIYLFIGGGAVVLDLAVFTAFTELLNQDIFLSNSLSISVAAIYSFLANMFFNFQVSGKILRRFASFMLVTFCGYLISLAILWLLADVLGVHALIAKIVTLPFVVVTQYVLNSRLTFRPDKKE